MFPRFFVKKLIFLEFLGYGMQIEGKQNTVSTIAKCDLVIKNWKRTNQRMYRLEVAMTIFMRCEDPMEEEVRSVANSSSTSQPVQDEEMALRI